jgi:aspartyl-tRNA(Asn)/glutamyl-tRNA(Gln) amidotransferase subunit C
VIHLSHLANLPLSDEEISVFSSQLQETIEYVDNLKELDTSHADPTSSSSNQLNVTFKDGEANTRGLTAEEATSNSLKSKNGYFVVTRIM